MTMIRWNPYRDMMSLRQAMDKLFQDSFVRKPSTWGDLTTGAMAIDLYQTEDDVVVKAVLPGVKPDEVDISIVGDTLTIKGEHKKEEESKDKNYIYKESSYGAFSRSIALPSLVKSDKAEADFEDGVLTITVPKAEEIKPKQIKVKAKGAIESKK